MTLENNSFNQESLKSKAVKPSIFVPEDIKSETEQSAENPAMPVFVVIDNAGDVLHDMVAYHTRRVFTEKGMTDKLILDYLINLHVHFSDSHNFLTTDIDEFKTLPEMMRKIGLSILDDSELGICYRCIAENALMLQVFGFNIDPSKKPITAYSEVYDYKELQIGKICYNEAAHLMSKNMYRQAMCLAAVGDNIRWFTQGLMEVKRLMAAA